MLERLKNWKAVLGYLVFCLTVLLSAGFMIFEIVEYAHPEWKRQPWGIHAYTRQSKDAADPP
jgi:heme/copper-type cytochrome/quinol oxidase subunit 3